MRRFPGQIHLLVTDIVMPQMGGPELAARLAHMRPALRAVFMSGHPNDRTYAPYLEKPLTVSSLAGKVREVLDAPLVA